MATSGSYSFTLDAEKVVEQALSLCGKTAAGQSVPAVDMQLGLTVFNLMIKSWAHITTKLWTKQTMILFLVPGQEIYRIGAGSTDRFTTSDDMVITLTGAVIPAASSTIDVVSTAGMAIGDVVGIELDDQTIHWDTIATIPSSIQLTIAGSTPSISTNPSRVVAYTSLAVRPLRILDCRRAELGIDGEVPIMQVSRERHDHQYNKQSLGVVNSYHYTPILERGELFVWQTGNTQLDVLYFTVENTLQDILDKTDNIQIPSEWEMTAVYNLAQHLGLHFSIPQRKQQSIDLRAERLLIELEGHDTEQSSIFLSPDHG